MTNNTSVKPRSSLLTLMLTFFLDFVGLFMVAPIFAPLFLGSQSLIVSPATTHGQRTLIIGLLVASYGIGQLFGGPLLGELSDQWGRKKVLIGGLCFLVMGNLLGALSLMINNLSLLFLCRWLTGVASGNGAVLFAAASDMSRNDTERGINIGYLTGAGALGAVVAPLMGSRFSDTAMVGWFHYYTPFLLMAFVFAVNIVLLICIDLPDTHPHLRSEQKHRKHKRFNFFIGFQNIRACFCMPSIRLLLIVYFLFVVATESSFVSVPIFSVEKFHFNTQQIGNLMAVGAAFSAFSSLILNKKLSQLLNSRKIFFLCMLILTIGYLLFLLVTKSFQLYIPWAICSFSMVLAWAHANAIIASRVSADIQGKVLGVTQSLLSLSIILGPLAVGLIAAIHYNLAISLSMVACFLSLLLFFLSTSPFRLKM